MQAQFRREGRAVAEAVLSRSAEPGDLVDPSAWEVVLATVWAAASHVFDEELARIARRDAFEIPKQSHELTALLQLISGQGRPAGTVRDFINQRASGIVISTRRAIADVLSEFNPNSPTQVRVAADSLLRLFNTEWVDGGRAARIALQETLAAVTDFQHGAAIRAQQITGRQYIKVWITQGDNSVRESHRDADGQQRPLDRPFDVGFDQLMYPRDGVGTEVYNCRCWMDTFQAIRRPGRLT